MSEVLHITPTRNIPSIEKYGILGSEPLLPQFKEYAAKYIMHYEKSAGVIFTLLEGQNLQNKYLKDFVYWHIWGRPRNLFLGKLGAEWNDKWERVYSIGCSIFQHTKLVEEHFTILYVNAPDNSRSTNCIHEQSSRMTCMFKDIDPLYEHDDKVITLFNQPLKVFRIVGNMSTTVKRNNKLYISLSI